MREVGWVKENLKMNLNREPMSMTIPKIAALF